MKPLKGTEEFGKRVEKAMKRKELVCKLIRQGASVEEIRKIAPFK